ncbi:MAG: hypothetical protein IJ383_06875 [Bacteroidales bacterium]|nr:hypothetical protein [Bacteroidales bacterium]
MKLIFSAIIATFMMGTGLYAQESMQCPQDIPQSHNIQEQGEQQAKKKFTTREEMQSQKIAFFTQELNLSPEEAQMFWPVYNAANKELHSARKEINGCLKELHNALNSETPASDSQIKSLMDKYLKACQAEIDVQAETFEDLSKVVPVHKAAKTFSLEERFRVMMIKQLRK